MRLWNQQTRVHHVWCLDQDNHDTKEFFERIQDNQAKTSPIQVTNVVTSWCANDLPLRKWSGKSSSVDLWDMKPNVGT